MAPRRLTLTCLAAAVLAGAAAVAVASSRAGDWRPLALVGLLFCLAAGSELLSVEGLMSPSITLTCAVQGNR